MPSGFPSDFKELVRSRTDLVALIGESVALSARSGGREFAALCPFHDDHDPSMRVYPDRQSYRCWVCDEGGDCFSWVQKIDRVGFVEALEMLARRANIEIPKRMGRASNSDSHDRNSLHEIVAWADREFHQCFLNAPFAAAAREYIASRGFTDETIRKYRIGYHPDNWQWLLDKARGLYSTEELATVRLVGEKRDGSGYIDYFVNRVLFPIRDERGRPVAFGGRVIPGARNENDAKYWNSLEGPIFSKSSLLYGFDAARDAIRKANTAVVVEGYTDCITLHQHGVENVVATLGTSLTEQHVRNLKRFARKVVLNYDGDSAGQRAAERALAKFLVEEIDLRVLTIPNGLDPADYIETHGPQALNELIENAPEALEYKLQAAVARNGVESIDARERVLDEVLELIGQTPKRATGTREDAILGRLSVRLGVDERKLRARLHELRQTLANRTSVNNPNTYRVDSEEVAANSGFFDSKLTKDDLVECELLEIIFTATDSISAIGQEIGSADFRNPFLRRLFQLCLDVYEQGELPTFERVTSIVEEPDLKSITVWIDQQAREKQIARILQDDDATCEDAEAPGPAYLKQAIAALRWRREELSHELRKGEFGQTAAATTGLNEDKIAMLRQATAHHQQRVTKKTLN